LFIALKINWAQPIDRPVGMLRDIFWLSTGQAIAITNAKKDQRVEVKEVITCDDGLIIKYLPNSESASQFFRTIVKERIAANSEADGMISVSDYDLEKVRRIGSVH
jgi:hypothetical protein